MSNLDLFLMGLGNLFRRKMRTALTVLGVVIGTTSILVMIAIGIGMQRKFEETLAQFGDLTKINVIAGYTNQGEKKFTEKAISDFWQIKNVKAVIPKKRINGTLWFGKKRGWAQVYALDFSLLKYINMELVSGRMPQRGEVLAGSEVTQGFTVYKPNGEMVVPDIDLLKDEFELTIYPDKPGTDDVEKRMKMRLKPVGVVGSEHDWEVSSSIFIDINDYDEFMERYNRKYKIKPPTAKELETIGRYETVEVFANTYEDVEQVVSEIKAMGFECYVNGEWLRNQQKNADMIKGVLGAVGAVSLFVAAIGITNTMVMSIYERIREIGVMKVIGAKVVDIRKLFLVEAAMIGLFGGLVGVGSSYGVMAILNKLAALLSKSGEIGDPFSVQIDFSQAYLPPEIAVLGALFAMLIGVLAGLYPSIKATRLSALEAIRTD